MIKQLLNILPDALVEDVQEKFKDIAQALFNQYEIVKDKKVYQFIEIEFYFYNKAHADHVTYTREMSAGYWHTHLSGVDISFESNKDCYGGVLIRSIMDEKGNVTNGPLCVLMQLFDNIDVEGKSNNIPQIRKKEKCANVCIEKTFRFNVNSGDYERNKYRYYNASDEIKWKSTYTANPRRVII